MIFPIYFTFLLIEILFIISKCSKGNSNELFSYRTYEQINDFLKNVQAKHKDKVTFFTIGSSVEGRDISGIKINVKNDNRTKNAIIMDAGMHAREWIAPVVLLYTINQLLENNNYSNFIEELDWYLLPMLNPDGYVYSMDVKNGNRLWRKNRGDTLLPYCKGVDLNRNFDYVWGGEGASSDPCAPNYMGLYPLSEPESKAFAEFVLSIKDNVKMYLTLHSAAKAIIYPWGYADEVPPDWMDLEKAAQQAARNILEINGTQYTIGPTTRVVGAGAGGSDDWAKGAAQIKYVFTMELPGLEYPLKGFHPIEKDIPLICIESFHGILGFAETLI